MSLFFSVTFPYQSVLINEKRILFIAFTETWWNCYILDSSKGKKITFSCVHKKKESNSNFIILQICHLLKISLCMYVLFKNKITRWENDFPNRWHLNTWFYFKLKWNLCYIHTFWKVVFLRVFLGDAVSIVCLFFLTFFFVKIITSKN